jgi:release factor glutamine methyltransferase
VTTTGEKLGTVGLLLEREAMTLRAAGVRDGRREALQLWAAVAATSPGAVWSRRETVSPPELARAFAVAVRRRVAGEPVAYATGSAAFRLLDLEVDRRVLIPRPETEGLVEHVLRWAAARARWGLAVDVGTGSGCIALSLATEGRFSRVIASDLSPAALAVARRNAERVGAATPVEFREGDLLWPLGPQQADVIVANPPYVSAAEWDGLDPGVRDHEPRVALVGGADGLAHTGALLRAAGAHLQPGGLLGMELDCRRAGQALALARSCGWTNARVERDLFGSERYLLATRESV